MFIYFWEREREGERQNVSRVGAEREGDRIESRLQALSCQHRARCRTPTHEPWDHELSRSWTVNWLSHPGVPIPHLYLFIYRWRLGCFHNLAIVNNVAINIGVCVSLQISVLGFFVGKYSVVWLLDHRVVLFLTFWGIPILFSTMAAQVCIPTNSAQRFLFLHILANTCCFLSCLS